MQGKWAQNLARCIAPAENRIIPSNDSIRSKGVTETSTERSVNYSLMGMSCGVISQGRVFQQIDLVSVFIMLEKVAGLLLLAGLLDPVFGYESNM